MFITNFNSLKPSQLKLKLTHGQTRTCTQRSDFDASWLFEGAQPPFVNASSRARNRTFSVQIFQWDPLPQTADPRRKLVTGWKPPKGSRGKRKQIRTWARHVLNQTVDLSWDTLEQRTWQECSSVGCARPPSVLWLGHFPVTLSNLEPSQADR